MHKRDVNVVKQRLCYDIVMNAKSLQERETNNNEEFEISALLLLEYSYCFQSSCATLAVSPNNKVSAIRGM